MKKVLIITVIVVLAIFSIYSCQKTESWDFNYPKEVLCGGTWRGVEIQSKGEWIDITSAAYKDFQFSIQFNTDGTYYATGYFGDGKGTYQAYGNTIKTYVDGDLYYTYTVHSMQDSIAELTMADSSNSMRIRVKK